MKICPTNKTTRVFLLHMNSDSPVRSRTARKQERIRARAAELVDIERQAKALAARQLLDEAESASVAASQTRAVTQRGLRGLQTPVARRVDRDRRLDTDSEAGSTRCGHGPRRPRCCRSPSRSCSPPPCRPPRCRRVCDYGCYSRPLIPGGFINSGLIGPDCGNWGNYPVSVSGYYPGYYAPAAVAATVTTSSVCGPSGCSLVTQPQVTACGPLGCTTSYGPANLAASVVDGCPRRFF